MRTGGVVLGRHPPAVSEMRQIMGYPLSRQRFVVRRCSAAMERRVQAGLNCPRGTAALCPHCTVDLSRSFESPSFEYQLSRRTPYAPVPRPKLCHACSGTSPSNFSMIACKTSGSEFGRNLQLLLERHLGVPPLTPSTPNGRSNTSHVGTCASPAFSLSGCLRLPSDAEGRHWKS